ncbi:hypothetical protein Trisim1_006053 [Trichoderma cf. simile WF8]
MPRPSYCRDPLKSLSSRGPSKTEAETDSATEKGRRRRRRGRERRRRNRDKKPRAGPSNRAANANPRAEGRRRVALRKTTTRARPCPGLQRLLQRFEEKEKDAAAY